MKLRHFVLATTLAAASCGFIQTAQASSVLVPTPQKFTQLANTIAHVKVEKTSAAWVDGRIITTVTARVIEPLKGSRANEVITFSVPGGRIGNLEAVSSGTPVFEAEEEAVLYLEQGNLGRRYLLGQALGLYRVHYDNRRGQFMATRDISKLGLVAASPEVKIEDLPRIRELKLQDLLKEIKEQIKNTTEIQQ